LGAPPSYFDGFVAGYRRRRDLLVDGLQAAGFGLRPPEGTYFVLADHTPFGFADDVSFARHLATDIGVAAIPPSSFYDDPADGAGLIRFAFCKPEADLIEAVSRLGSLHR
ncbi:MAG: aminotransferase class I/II-fold pyridoxal phosphate-dependent enzyme, partial [Actinomycetota bacterium]|nr:aminotransferase class I/II-fold pyridoxal phosphate-dependent enzyme [Actinomycetota bacterium]